MEIQFWDGDAEEPDHIRIERERAERRYQERLGKVGKRLALREHRLALAKIRGKSKPIVRCERFEVRYDGNKAHFHIKSTSDPRSLIFFAGDKFKEMTFRYPARDDVRDPMRMPVVLRAIKPKVIQMHAVEPMVVEEDEDHPLFWEVSITISFDELINDSQKVYKAFRKSILLPVAS